MTTPDKAHTLSFGKLRKIFGIGPVGAAVSLLLFALFSGLDSVMGLPILPDRPGLMKTIGGIWVIFGLGLHVWSFSTLRSWWAEDQLCTKGPFKYFRHPMYAAWISRVCPGVALYLNSWSYLLWVFGLHPIWHKLVKNEETTMLATFGEAYKEYAQLTGRFIPRVRVS